MPAKSKAQRKLIGLTLHHPDEVIGENRSILSMDKSDMEDYASTKEKGLPKHKKSVFALKKK